MPSTTTCTLPVLLKRYEALTREIAAREAERTAVHAQILTAGRGTGRRTVQSPGRPARTRAQTVEVVRDTVRVLREAGAPLPRREIAARLGIQPWAATYRLDRAVELKLVEKLGGGLYQVTSVVPAF